MTCASFLLLIEQWMFGIVCQTGLLLLTVLTLLDAGWIHIGKTRRLSKIFMHSYREPEVTVKNLDMTK